MKPGITKLPAASTPRASSPARSRTARAIIPLSKAGGPFFNVLVPYGEFLVGLGLILGTFTTFAALMGLVMNAAFLFSGTVSTNAQMLLLEVLVVVAAANAGKIGLDYYVLPYLRKLFGKKGDTGTKLGAPQPPVNVKHTA
nr:DoxX family membrane protein [Paenibacillus macerans]